MNLRLFRCFKMAKLRGRKKPVDKLCRGLRYWPRMRLREAETNQLRSSERGIFPHIPFKRRRQTDERHLLLAR